MESVTEVRYVGVVVGRGATLRSEASGAFVVFPEPLPVGTALVLRGEEGDQPAQVVEVIESADPNIAGMRVRFTGGIAVARGGAKSVAPAAAPAAPPPPTAVSAAPVPEAPAAPAAHAAPAASETAAPSATESEPGSGGEPASESHGHAAEPGQGGDQGHGSGKRRKRRR